MPVAAVPLPPAAAEALAGWLLACPPAATVTAPAVEEDKDGLPAYVEVDEGIVGRPLGPSPKETVGGVDGRLSSRIFWITRALVRTGTEEDRTGAKVTEPSSSESGSRSSNLKLLPPPTPPV